MALSVKVIPGYQFGENERIDQVKLNQLGRPTIELQGAIAASAILPGSVTSEKLSPFLISSLTPKDPPLGSDLVMIQDATGLKRTTIDDILELNAPTLETITEVALKEDYAWIIQKGDNKQATIQDVLRQAINKQPELATTPEIDPLNDEVLLYDFSAPAGGNQNRKAKLKTTVRAATNTLIEDSPQAGAIDRTLDEILVRDVSATSPNQQVRVTLGALLGQSVGVKAWVNFDASLSETVVRVSFNKATETITTRQNDDPQEPEPRLLKAGDYIWTNEGRDIPGIEFYTPYYVHPYVHPVDGESATQLELYKTKAAAIARDQSQRVTLQVLNPNDREYEFFMWPNDKAPPIRNGFNVSSVIRNGGEGRFRVNFASELPSDIYATTVQGGQGTETGGYNGAIDYTKTPPTATYVDVAFYRGGGEHYDTKQACVTVVQ